MFGKLKEKLKSWTKNLTNKASEESEVKEKIEESPEETKPLPHKKIKNLPGKEIEKKLKKENYSEPKKKFNVGAQKYEPDLEESEKIVKKEKKSFFKKISSKINNITISEKNFENYSEELEMLLLENNVALEVAERITKKLKEEIVGKEILKKEIESKIKDSLKEIIDEILIEPFDLVEKIKNREDKSKPYVVLFCGINGTGKTTTIAKISNLLKSKGISSVLAAGDTFRAASIEQLKTHGEKLGVKTISHEYGSDPASVGFDTIKYAEKNKVDCVLIDTAGRMYTEKNLMSEIEKIAKVCKPQTKIFVGESITGNDAIEQVRNFNDAIGIDGIILSKSDIDEKGGTALSVGFVTKKPILYLGTGQEYEKIEPFDKDKFIEKLDL